MPVKIVGIIPARYASTRFPGKPLALIAGKPLIQRVIIQCRKAKSLAEVIVATDDARIREVAQKFCRVEMTRPEHPSGSDRIAEVAERCDCDAVVNIQGDEPLIEPSVIDAVAGALEQNEMSTAATRIKNPAELDNPNVVKVVVNAAGRALYFSRRTIPYLRDNVGQASRLSSERASASGKKDFHTDSAPDLGRRDARPTLAASGSATEQLAAFAFLKHLGIYGYRRETLLRLVKFPVSPLEAAEKLEQLRALENGIPIAVVQVSYDSVGVDTPGDVEWVERYLTTDKHR
jgi:3-deoxy-manno-octulosonate cytidylyltransferase (CMP-KDO synthetase)